MENNFNSFLSDIQLSETQKQDAKTKYEGVCSCLDKHFYDSHFVDSHKFLFGSYKTHTNIRPIDENQDVDVLFKIDYNTYKKYEENPSGLLQEIRNALKEKYTTTDKISAWQKVVLVKFSDGKHNVEVLPAYENEDGTFKIPNTKNGGFWEQSFSPRSQIEIFNESNKNTKNLTRNLIQIVKTWRKQLKTMDYPSFLIVEDVIEFVDKCYPSGKGNERFDEIIQAFFNYILTHLKGHRMIIKSFLETAKTRCNNAIQYENEGKHIEASEEWIKILGSLFPKSYKNDEKDYDCYIFSKAPRPWCN